MSGELANLRPFLNHRDAEGVDHTAPQAIGPKGKSRYPERTISTSATSPYVTTKKRSPCGGCDVERQAFDQRLHRRARCRRGRRDSNGGRRQRGSAVCGHSARTCERRAAIHRQPFPLGVCRVAAAAPATSQTCHSVISVVPGASVTVSHKGCPRRPFSDALLVPLPPSASDATRADPTRRGRWRRAGGRRAMELPSFCIDASAVCADV
jgi:hypothetical protein